jgi:hypothetical protein
VQPPPLGRRLRPASHCRITGQKCYLLEMFFFIPNPNNFRHFCKFSPNSVFPLSPSPLVFLFQERLPSLTLPSGATWCAGGGRGPGWRNRPRSRQKVPHRPSKDGALHILSCSEKKPQFVELLARAGAQATSSPCSLPILEVKADPLFRWGGPSSTCMISSPQGPAALERLARRPAAT